MKTLPAGEVRASSDEAFQLSGIAARTGVRSQNLGGFVEIIKPGAFTRALREKQDVRCLLNHDVNIVLGRVSNCTLLLSEMRDGSLAFICKVVRKRQSHGDTLHPVRRSKFTQI